MVETKGIGGCRKLLIERYSDFMDVLKKEGQNVAYVGTETHNLTTYFYVCLKK